MPNHHALWLALLDELQERFGKRPDLSAVLFLVGVQELGQLRSHFTKEEKQDLMHLAVCHLLSQDGYFVLAGTDNDGWRHYSPTGKLPPDMRGWLEQEELLRTQLLAYFGKI